MSGLKEIRERPLKSGLGLRDLRDMFLNRAPVKRHGLHRMEVAPALRAKDGAEVGPPLVARPVTCSKCGLVPGQLLAVKGAGGTTYIHRRCKSA